MDLSHDWDVVLDELVASHLQRRGMAISSESAEVRRLRTFLVASLHSDIQVQLANLLETLVTKRLDSMDDIQVTQWLNDTDLDIVDLHLLIEETDPTAPPMSR